MKYQEQFMLYNIIKQSGYILEALLMYQQGIGIIFIDLEAESTT